MPPATVINDFLDRIREKWLSIRITNGIYLFFTVLTSGLLLANLTVYFTDDPKKYLPPFLSILSIALGYVLIRYLVHPIASGYSKERAALLAESQIADLNNALINGCQLQERLEEPDAEKTVSLDFIHKMLRETQNRIQGFPIDQIENLMQRPKSLKSRNWFLAVLGMVLIASLLLPEFFTLGYKKWNLPSPRPDPVLIKATLPQVKPGPSSATSVSITSIRLKFSYPAYTRIPSKTVDPSDGKINVLPGTEVQITAQVNTSLSNADLVINGKDHFTVTVDKGRELSGSFIVNEKGFYQYWIKTEEGHRNLLEQKYSILLKKDHSPRITLFLENPKPVYHENEKIKFYYEGHDDFGIQTIHLVINVDGKPTRKRIKALRGAEMEIKDGYVWNLREMILRPGDPVEYYLEIQDNDNINGPNTGRSEIYSFTVFDSPQELENLIALQDELINRMVTLLSKTLVEHQVIPTESLEDPVKVKKALTSNSDKLIEIIHLIHKIYDQAQPVQMLSLSYLTFFKNMLKGLTSIRAKQIQFIKKLGRSIGHTVPVGHNFPPINLLNEKLIEYLERDILFLVKITNRQKMKQVLNLKDQLRKLTDSIREEFDKVQNKKTPPSIDELRQLLQKTQHLMDKMIEQFSRQTQGLPDEFLNSNAFKSLNIKNFKASIDKMLDLINQGKIDEAMKKLNEMTEDLQTLENQLDQTMSTMDQMLDEEVMKKIDESLQDLLKLEKKQKDLFRQTTNINRELRKAQVDKLESKLKDFFEGLIKDVQVAQSLLQRTDQFLKENPKLKSYNHLLNQEAELKKAIQELSQKMRDLATNPNISEKFLEIRELRKELANTIHKRQELRVESYQDFKNSLPEIQEKYDGLEELAELFDIREFNSLFKGTYPMAFRWQHKIRMIPLPITKLSDKLQKSLNDLRHVNTGISKKLGSMLRELEKEYNSLISEADKDKLQDMSQKQNQMRMEAQNLEQKLAQMDQKNPIIDPEIASKMSAAGRYMKMAEKNLKKPDITQSIDSENGALEKMAETRDMLNQLKNTNQRNSNSRHHPIPRFGAGPVRDVRRGGSVRMQRERVDLPSEDRHKSPVEFRAEILDAMKGQHPKKYERFITEYYRKLVE